MLHIVPPRAFWHAGDLSERYASVDPRTDPIDPDGIEVDLRKCDFVRPPAALWCVVYPALARQKRLPVKLLVPDNMGVCVYLKSCGVFDTLKGLGVQVDDRQVWMRRDRKVVLPLTTFQTETRVDELANQVLERLGENDLGATNLRPLVTETFAELAMNAVQHSESPVDAFGLVQFYGFGLTARFVCVVADGGIGIRKGLEKNPALRSRFHYDWDAIELATKERISGTRDPHRGIGLYQIAEDFRKPGRRLIIHSGRGMMSIDETAQSAARRVPLYPGTLVFASIPT